MSKNIKLNLNDEEALKLIILEFKLLLTKIKFLNASDSLQHEVEVIIDDLEGLL